MERKRGRLLQRLRILSQCGFTVLFFFLLATLSGSGPVPMAWSGLFFYFDPLLLWLSLVAGPLLRVFLLALAPLLLTLLLGRFFCGWVCPLGALHQLFTWLGRRRPQPPAVRRGELRLKYLLLAGLLAASLFSVQLLGWLDPFSLLTRSAAVAVLPGGGAVLQKALLAGPQPLYDLGRRLLLPVTQRVFLQASAIGAVFLGLLLLNLLRRRFFCNALCPLGALYGALGRFSLLRLAVNDSCRKCNACARRCTYTGGPYQDYLKSECLLCFNCVADCPADSIELRFGLPGAGRRPALDLGRRRLLAAAGIGIAAAALPLASPPRAARARPFLRPPGALDEEKFLARCVRCGACMQACPTHALQPAIFQAGLEGLWTPALVPAVGYCEYECRRCTQVCPTQAIARLSLAEKKQFKIGTAVVDRSLCYTYADGYNCAVCEEHCPVPEKAIRFRPVEIHNFRGRMRTVNQIYVVPDLCIGCGICENVCPRTDLAAIRVGAEEEQRGIPGA